MQGQRGTHNEKAKDNNIINASKHNERDLALCLGGKAAMH